MKLPFDLFQLKCFVALANTLHFGQAAERLNMTQSPLSRQIALLEERLGVGLFHRTKRSVNLTPAGQFFLHEARAILKRAEDMSKEVKLAAEGELGPLVVGFTATASYELLPRLVQRHHQKFPRISFIFKEHLIEENIRMLGEGTVNVAIIRPPVDSAAYDSFPLMKDRWAVAMPANHVLSSRKTVSLQLLHGLPMIAWSPTSKYFHHVLEGLYTEHNVVPRNVVFMSQLTAMLGMVHRGIGVAVVPLAVASNEFTGICVRPLVLNDGNSDHLELLSILAWRRDNVSAAVHRFIETAKEIC